MNPQLQQLTDFWNLLKEKGTITFKDWEELQNKFSDVYLKVQELEKSKENWKERCLLAESKLKEKKA